jgi:hypothetical protein
MPDVRVEVFEILGKRIGDQPDYGVQPQVVDMLAAGPTTEEGKLLLLLHTRQSLRYPLARPSYALKGH